jgi:uncharacterized protein (TIGR03086 family)
MSTADLEQAVKSTAAVLAKVTPDQLDASTPCASWKVRDVINHVVGWTHNFGRVASGDEADMSLLEQDYASDDFNASFATGSAKLIGAFQAEGALERPMSLMGGEMPGAFIMGIATTDIFTHGWDLARAIGEPTDFEPELAGRLLTAARQNISDQMRGEEGSGAFFGPRVDVPDSAPPADQLAGFLGRHV